MADKPIGKDATGYEILTDAMKALLIPCRVPRI